MITVDAGVLAKAMRHAAAVVESYITGAPQRPLEVVGATPPVGALIDPFMSAFNAVILLPRDAEAERADFLAYLERRIGNAAAVERSTAPDAETRELAGDRRRQMEVIRDEIAQGMHVSAAAVAAKLREDSLAAVLADLGSAA